MTQKHTPDRIWSTGTSASGSWNGHEVRHAPHQKQYLAATPAREAADELLEDLIEILDALPFGDEPEKARAAIAKAKGE